MKVLETKGLSKNYGHIKALQNLNLTINQGEVFGILGPNGSGKTTTLGIILNILKASGGQYEWFEGQYKNPRLRIGAILETPNFLPYLNAEQNLRIVARIKNIESQNFDSYLDTVNLLHRKESKFSTYSLGMKQRLAIAATMIGEPDVLIFDEPTNGLDPEGIAEVRNILNNIAAMNKTVIMASHILAEVEKICSHVGILKNGTLLASGPVGSILSDEQIIEIDAPGRAELSNYLKTLPSVLKIIERAEFIEVHVPQEFDSTQLSKLCADSNIYINHLVIRKANLEEEFLAITQNAG